MTQTDQSPESLPASRRIRLAAWALLVAVLIAGAIQITGILDVSSDSKVSDKNLTHVAIAQRSFAPKISGQTIGGGSYELLPGKVTVINIWASWCSPCKAETPLLVALASELPLVQFVGLVSDDTDAAALEFMQANGVSYPTLQGGAIIPKFANSLAVVGLPTTLVLDRQGRVAARIMGAVNRSTLISVVAGLTAELQS